MLELLLVKGSKKLTPEEKRRLIPEAAPRGKRSAEDSAVLRTSDPLQQLMAAAALRFGKDVEAWMPTGNQQFV